MAMYINTASPDPDGHLDHGAAIRSRREANGNQGQNSAGWCNEEASAIDDTSPTRRVDDTTPVPT